MRGFECDRCKHFFNYSADWFELGCEIQLKLKINGKKDERVYCNNCTMRLYDRLDGFENES